MNREILIRKKQNGTFEYVFSEGETALLNEAFSELTPQEWADKYEEFAKLVFEAMEKHKHEIVEPFLMMKFISEYAIKHKDQVTENVTSSGGCVVMKPVSARTTIDLSENPFLATCCARYAPESISVSEESVMTHIREVKKALKQDPDNEELQMKLNIYMDFARQIKELRDNGNTRQLRESTVSILDVISAYRQLQAIISKAEEWQALFKEEPETP